MKTQKFTSTQNLTITESKHKEVIKKKVKNSTNFYDEGKRDEEVLKQDGRS